MNRHTANAAGSANLPSLSLPGARPMQMAPLYEYGSRAAGVLPARLAPGTAALARLMGDLTGRDARQAEPMCDRHAIGASQ